jgi:amino acid transporter
MTAPMAEAQPGLVDRKKLSTTRIVFLVVAAAAPLAAMVGNVPLALKLGNGPGLPGAFVLATVVLFCFAVGYAAMSRKVVNTGAFYTYVARGLGKPPAVSAAFVAVLSYNALAAGLVGAFGYFGSVVLDGAGIHGVPWLAVSAVGWAVTAVLGYRSVDVSAKVLAVLMIAEILILLLLDFGIIGHRGAAALPATVFSPSTVFSGALGLALMFAFASFIGFESAALYGEESHDPQRSIPRATYASVLIIGAFYTFTTWCIVGGGGVETAARLKKGDLGTLVLDLNAKYVGPWAHDLMAVFFVTSLLASLLAIHNAASRYMFALGRERILPSALGRFHPRRYSPYVASVTQSGVNAVVVLAFAIAGLDPYLSLAASMVGISTLGIVALQMVAAISIIVFFWRRGEVDVWRTIIAPLIGAVGLCVAAVLLTANYSTLTGTRSFWVNGLPVLLVGVALAGVGYALWLRRRRPDVYRGLAEVSLRRSSERSAASAEYDDDADRYCIVGGGPAGLVMARAFDREGIPYDLYERHSGLGGIWDPDNDGSPVYESAHFISSKYTSHFFGFPMPADYPDYPTHRQILLYIRAFAREYGLDLKARTGVAVTSAVPSDGGWVVTLSTGETRTYRGIVCANGVTWHPRLPDYPGLERFTGELRHSVTYRSSREFQGRRVLVVGAGNSGVDIACDAAQAADAAFLSVRRGYRFVPKHIFGIPTDVFMTRGGLPPRGVVVPDDPTRLVDSLVGDLTRYGLPAPDHELLESHPIMNTQILHHLAHGNIRAKGDVREFRADSVVFADGSEELVDLVLFATGYDYAIPYIAPDLFDWNQGRPDLYLNVLHRQLDGLYALGFVEFADAAYQRFDEMAQLVVIDAHARRTGEGLDELKRLRAEDRPDLRGGHHYIDSPRHAAYVDSGTYQRYLAEIRDRFGFADPDDEFYPTRKPDIRESSDVAPSILG